MITSADCIRRYGPPSRKHEGRYMTMCSLAGIADPRHPKAAPRKVYCNKDLVAPLQAAFRLIVDRDLADVIKTWDGCYNLRTSKGNAKSWSLHAWGLAIDLNAATNGYGKPPTLPAGFVRCWKEAGFDWGGSWRTPDGMHFQLAAFPK